MLPIWLLIVIAVVIAVVIIKRIIRKRPGFITIGAINNIKGLFQAGQIEMLFFDEKVSSKQRKAFSVARVIVDLGVLHYLLENEQRKQLGKVTIPLSKKTQRIIEGGKYHYCRSLIQRAKSTMEGLAEKDSEEFNYPRAMRMINGLENYFCESICLLDQIELKFDQAKSLLESIESSDVEIIEICNDLNVNLINIQNDLNNSADLNPIVLSGIINSLSQIIEVAEELTGGVTSKESNWVDYYEVLGITPKASKEEIKKAYRAKTSTFHPDTKRAKIEEIFFDKPEVIKILEAALNKQTIEIGEAYRVLSDDASRAKYDMEFEKRKGGG